jgi:hypothetical protein
LEHTISFCFVQKTLGERPYALADLAANTLPQSCLRHAGQRIQRSRLLQASEVVPETLVTNMTMATFEPSPPAQHNKPHHHQRAQHSLPAKLYIRSRTDQFRCFGSSRPNLAGQSREKICRPTHASLHEPHTRTPAHQYNLCRGSSIGRACGSYNSER